FSACSRWVSGMSVHLLDGDHVSDRRDHPPDLGAVLLHHDVTDPLEAERAQRVPLVAQPADRRADLGDPEPTHQPPTPARARSSAAGATSSSGSPRRSATASGRSSIFSARTVACTMLIALSEPSDLLRTSW